MQLKSFFFVSSIIDDVPFEIKQPLIDRSYREGGGVDKKQKIFMLNL